MSFAESFLEELRLRVPISALIGRSVAWDAKKSNTRKGDHWAPCPFHGEKTASFHCDDTKGLYHCFGCKASGDHFVWAKEKLGLTFRAAVEMLAREAGLAIPEQTPEQREREQLRVSLYDVCEAAARIFAANLAAEPGAPARAYLDQRGIPETHVLGFRLGFAKNSRRSLFEALKGQSFSDAAIIAAGLARESDAPPFAALDRFWNRIMFPICDARGRVVGFGGRALGPEQLPKYLNSPETPLFDKSSLLYNRHKAFEDSDAAKGVMVVEGYMDVLACARDGIDHAVAPMGTAVTPQQLEGLWKLSDEPLFCLDGDAAGQKAMARVMEMALPLLKPGRSLSFATLPAGKDPDDILREGGPGALASALKETASLSDRLWAGFTADADVSTPERRAKFQQGIVDGVAKIADATVRKHYEADLTERLKRFWKDKGLKPVGPAFEKKPNGEKPDAGGRGGKGGPPQFGPQDIDDMNERYAVVIMGQRVAILLDDKEDVGRAIERVRFMNVDAFHQWLANKRSFHNGRNCSHSEVWFKDTARRQYRGLEFTPAPPGQSEETPGFFNLWRGFDVAPKKNTDLAAPWLNHVMENVADGNSETYDWVVSWFAWPVQRPRVRLGTSLALRGGMGTGKTITGKIVGSLFPANYFLIDEPRYLTGQFNSHLATALLLQVDEGFWAGDKQAEGRLKGLITSEFQMIEYKGIDPVRMPNYVSLLISSNDEWVVPAGLRERRFSVIDVSNRRIQDTKYFAAMDNHFRDPAAKAALLYELANWKIDEKALRKVPATEGLWIQKLRSFDSYHGWLAELLFEGGLGLGAEWPEYMECADLHAHYLKRCEKLGLRHPLSRDSFGTRLKRTLPDVRRFQRDGRKWHYLLPGLDAARESFARDVDYQIDWADGGSLHIVTVGEGEPM